MLQGKGRIPKDHAETGWPFQRCPVLPRERVICPTPSRGGSPNSASPDPPRSTGSPGQTVLDRQPRSALRRGARRGVDARGPQARAPQRHHYRNPPAAEGQVQFVDRPAGTTGSGKFLLRFWHCLTCPGAEPVFLDVEAGGEPVGASDLPAEIHLGQRHAGRNVVVAD